jgi:hypothetical protein
MGRLPFNFARMSGSIIVPSLPQPAKVSLAGNQLGGSTDRSWAGQSRSSRRCPPSAAPDRGRRSRMSAPSNSAKNRSAAPEYRALSPKRRTRARRPASGLMASFARTGSELMSDVGRDKLGKEHPTPTWRQIPANHAYPPSGDAEPKPLPNFRRSSVTARRVINLTFLYPSCRGTRMRNGPPFPTERSPPFIP